MLMTGVILTLRIAHFSFSTGTPSKTMRSSCRPAVLHSCSPGLLHTHVVLLLRGDADSADGNLPLLRKYPSAATRPTGASFVSLGCCSRIQRQKMTAAPRPFRFTAPCSRSMCAHTFLITARLHGLQLNARCERAPVKNTRSRPRARAFGRAFF